jgi:hypothetical protein
MTQTNIQMAKLYFASRSTSTNNNALDG